MASTAAVQFTKGAFQGDCRNRMHSQHEHCSGACEASGCLLLTVSAVAQDAAVNEVLCTSANPSFNVCVLLHSMQPLAVLTAITRALRLPLSAGCC
jgi:hypothetical protein